jgi:hypothetical protein
MTEETSQIHSERFSICHWGTFGFRLYQLETLYPVVETDELLEVLREYRDMYINDMYNAIQSPPSNISEFMKKNEKWYNDLGMIEQRLAKLVFHPIEYKNLTDTIDNEEKMIKKRHSGENGECKLDNATCYGFLNEMMLYLSKRVKERIDKYRKDCASSLVAIYDDKEDIKKWLEYSFYTSDDISWVRSECHMHQHLIWNKLRK